MSFYWVCSLIYCSTCKCYIDCFGLEKTWKTIFNYYFMRNWYLFIMEINEIYLKCFLTSFLVNNTIPDKLKSNMILNIFMNYNVILCFILFHFYPTKITFWYLWFKDIFVFFDWKLFFLIIKINYLFELHNFILNNCFV